MTIKKIIETADLAKPNDFEYELKVQWIAELDGKIAADVFLMGYSELGQFRYTHPESLEKEPLVTFPHDDIYRLWLMAKIDLANGEYNKYQNTMVAYNESYGNFVRWFARVWQPAQGGGGYQIRDDVPQYYITAYGLAVRAGFTGTLEEWFLSLKGDPGKSAYEYVKEYGYTGTEENFVQALTAVNEALAAAQSAKEACEKAQAAADTFETDPSLSEEGKAADAKATGEAIQKAQMKVTHDGDGVLSFSFDEDQGEGEDALKRILKGLKFPGILNEEFVMPGMVTKEISVNSHKGTENLTTQLKAIYEQMKDGSVELAMCNVVYNYPANPADEYYDADKYDEQELEGGIFVMCIAKVSSIYGSILAWRYGYNKDDMENATMLYFHKSITSLLRDDGAYDTYWTPWTCPAATERLLWKNATPTSTFTDNEIVFTEKSVAYLKQYNAVRIVCRHSANLGYTQSVFIAKNQGGGPRIGCAYFPYGKIRGDEYAAETKRYFILEEAYGSVSVSQGRTDSADLDDVAIPVEIYACNI